MRGRERECGRIHRMILMVESYIFYLYEIVQHIIWRCRRRAKQQRERMVHTQYIYFFPPPASKMFYWSVSSERESKSTYSYGGGIEKYKKKVCLNVEKTWNIGGGLISIGKGRKSGECVCVRVRESEVKGVTFRRRVEAALTHVWYDLIKHIKKISLASLSLSVRF